MRLPCDLFQPFFPPEQKTTTIAFAESRGSIANYVFQQNNAARLLTL